MSLLGILGLGFGTGRSSCDYPVTTNVRAGVVYAEGAMTGNVTLPAVGNVRLGVQYGANGTEFTGTLVVPAPPVPPVGTANQGVKPQSFLDALETYLQLISNFTGRNTYKVVLWCQPGRADIPGASQYVWFRPGDMPIDQSPGPMRFGNKYDMKFEVHVVTRSMVDHSQGDKRRIVPHFALCWKMIDALQNLHLFDGYEANSDPLPDPWYPPLPVADALPLTVEPMYLEGVPPQARTQYEEASIETTFTVVLPGVLPLSINDTW